MAQEIHIDGDLCQLCGECLKVCTRSNIRLGETAAHIKDPGRCILCGHCKSVCPVNAPQLPPLDPQAYEPVPTAAQIPAARDLLAFMRARRSIRNFKKSAVPPEKLDLMIEAGRYAPTGGNRQPLHYLILQTPEVLTEVRRLTHAHFAREADKILEEVRDYESGKGPKPHRMAVRQGYVPLWQAMGKLYQKGRDLLFYMAPAVIALHADPQRTSPFCADAGLAAMQMVLMAETLGLGTCFCGFLTVAANGCETLKAYLKIPPPHSVILSFMVGHPDVTYLRTVARNPARVTIL